MRKSVLLLAVILKRGLVLTTVRKSDLSVSLYAKDYRTYKILLYLKESQVFRYNLVDKFAMQFDKLPRAIKSKALVAIVHQLESHTHPSNLRIISVARFDKKTSELWAQSTQNIWASSIWAEREIYDMYGILFYGNGDLRRIITDYSFKGHPLRKEFPAKGVSEFTTVRSTMPVVNS